MLIENRNKIFKVVDYDYDAGYPGSDSEEKEEKSLSIKKLQVKFKGKFVPVSMEHLDLNRFIELEKQALEIYLQSLEPDYDLMRAGK